jgi:thioredoxin-like negative regulator of GroEL
MTSEPIPTAVQEVLDLFGGELASLKFGDLDPAALAGSADEVRVASASVARAQTELDAARGTLAEKIEALLQKAHRALAYARVYAEDQPELASRIEAISLPRAARRVSKVAVARPQVASDPPVPIADELPRRRRRTSKVTTEDTPLDLAASD